MEFLDDFKAVDFKRIPGAIGGVLVRFVSLPSSDGFPSEYPKHPERRVQQDEQLELEFDTRAGGQASPHFFED